MTAVLGRRAQEWRQAETAARPSPGILPLPASLNLQVLPTRRSVPRRGTVMVRNFDPDVEIGKLVDQLASHEKPVAFLFGAGTSASVKATDGHPLIPAVAALTKTCFDAVASSGAPYAEAWMLIWDALAPGEDNIEGVLSTVRRMQAAITTTDKLVGLNASELDVLADLIQRTISQEVRPDESRFPTRLPHAALARWIRRIDRQIAVEIFTTNYDTLIERSL
jgi:hypothetical protein